MNWIALKALHEIYERGETKKKETLMKDSQILFLLRQTGELKDGVSTIFKGDGFDAYYQKRHLQKFLNYNRFLENVGLLTPQLRYQESDIQVLMELQSGMASGELVPIRDEIIQAEETVRGVSQMFFRNEKYLEKSESLLRAVKNILGIAELANDKEQQYKYVLQCHKPKKIVLCENLDFLKRPSKPRKHNIELWYAGGKNIDKLNYIGEVSLPIFYSCDWDYDGLLTYQEVKKRIPSIRLLYPNGTSKSIVQTEHNSQWQSPSNPNLLSGLDPAFYSASEKSLIVSLITENNWIMEETNDLVRMVESMKN
ncbi:hypothetical protein [Adhaeribacter soli]|uniref:Wadjet protein JetD C-terminal domain-containing protein n=1 Tax=Adhaeribacter soli TaxID=2607655 RepID=A0A5N1IWX7_9BACT|nr:hypothetical protein [Adhaeribacter soli]KAA9338794.1 hypothetical protein F0P94_08330 [Adhaeribacter soli]